MQLLAFLLGVMVVVMSLVRTLSGTWTEATGFGFFVSGLCWTMADVLCEAAFDFFHLLNRRDDK